MKKIILLMSVLILNMYGRDLDLYDVTEGKNGLYHVKKYWTEKKKKLYMEYNIKSKEDLYKNPDKVAIGEVRTYQKNGYLYAVYNTQNKKLNGIYQGYSEKVNGRLISEVMTKNGFFIGKHIVYFDMPEKKIMKVTTYKDDEEIETLVEEYYKNGQLKLRVNMYEKRKEGEAVKYDPKGKVIYKAMFKDDECISGDCEKYNKNK